MAKDATKEQSEIMDCRMVNGSILSYMRGLEHISDGLAHPLKAPSCLEVKASFPSRSLKQFHIKFPFTRIMVCNLPQLRKPLSKSACSRCFK